MPVAAASSSAARAAVSMSASGSRPSRGSDGRSTTCPAPTINGRSAVIARVSLTHPQAASKVPRMSSAGTSNGGAPSRLRTPLCERLGIDYPIFLAGMGGVSMAPLVAAVSNAGGLGIMGAANLSPDDLRDEIRKTRTLTQKPFAVDLLAPIPEMILPFLPVLYDEGVQIFVAGLAVPEKQVPE